MNRLDLQPFFRSTIGFDEIADILDGLTEHNRKSNQYPPYNIERISEEDYKITVAVAGFKNENLDITKHNNLLSIEGKMDKKASPTEHMYLYKGIAERSFQLQFRLAEHMHISNVTLEHGMLSIDMYREIPEELKPQKIKINSKSTSALEQKETIIEGESSK